MGRRAREELLQANDTDPRHGPLAIRLQQNVNESDRRRIRREKGFSGDGTQHYTTLRLPERWAHVDIQETMEPVDKGAASESG